MSNTTQDILQAANRALNGLPPGTDEDGFVLSLSQQLGACFPANAGVEFHPPLHPPKPPPAGVADEHRIPPEGKDPCGGRRRKVDLVWNRDGSSIPIEVKFRTKWNVDSYGYYFLLDLHRLERLAALHGQPVADERFALFVTSVDDHWDARKSKDHAPLRVSHGRMITRRHWVQYDQPSMRTRWVDYPPFYLANPYTLTWTPLSGGFKALLVAVQSQAAVLGAEPPGLIPATLACN